MCQPCVPTITYFSYRFPYLPSNSTLPPHSSLPLEFPYACALTSRTQPPLEKVAMPSTDHGDAAAGHRDAAAALLFARKGASQYIPRGSGMHRCDLSGRIHRIHAFVSKLCLTFLIADRDAKSSKNRCVAAAGTAPVAVIVVVAVVYLCHISKLLFQLPACVYLCHILHGVKFMIIMIQCIDFHGFDIQSL